MKNFSFLFFILAAWNATAQNAVITSPASTVCIGQSVTLSSSASDAGNSVVVSSDWHIFGPDNFVLTGFTTPGNDFTFTPELPGSYSVTLINQHEDMTNAASNTANFITVYALPEAHFTLSDAIGCTGITLSSNATNTSIHPVGSYMEGNNTNGWSPNGFQWTVNGQISTTSTYNQTLPLSANGHTIILLSVTDAFGCISIPYVDSIIFEDLVANISVPVNLCNEGDILISSISHGANLSYTWTVDGVQLPVSTDSTIFPNWEIQNPNTLAEQHTVSLIVTNNGGCADTTSQIFTVHKPGANFIAEVNGTVLQSNSTFICPPQLINFTSTSQSFSGFTSWSWQFRDQDHPSHSATSSQQNPVLQAIFPGTYDIMFSVMDQHGCTDTIFIDNFFTIHGPAADVSVNQTGNLGFMEYSFNISNLDNVATITWNMGNGVTITDDMDGFIYAYPQSGIYNPTVTLADQNGCSVSYNLGPVQAGVNGLAENTGNPGRIYPNPAHDFIEFPLEKGTSIQIRDMNGKLLLESETEKTDISGLQNGIYFLYADGKVQRFQKI
ncbi:MAG: domain containing protein [Crocinitomicaceae bacterium]|jgi:hypothetical protein|nr:domain containing protein [Crocinitomicaceae bacterium]